MVLLSRSVGVSAASRAKASGWATGKGRASSASSAAVDPSAGAGALGASSRGCSSKVSTTSTHDEQNQPFFLAARTTSGCSGQVGAGMAG